MRRAARSDDHAIRSHPFGGFDTDEVEAAVMELRRTLLVAAGAGVLAAFFLALILASINVVGGYLVTDRMLEMFKKKGAVTKAKDS